MNIYLHFIGNRYYSMERFIEEGLRQGVQRAVPFSILRGMRSGDVVYYAKYHAEDKVAIVFAQGRIRGISSTYPYDRWIECTVVDEARYERRACGMSVVRNVITEATVEEIVQACIEHEDVAVLNRHKWFILTDIDEYHSVIYNTVKYSKNGLMHKPITFSRGYILLCGSGEPKSESAKPIKNTHRHILKYKEESAGYWYYKPPKTVSNVSTLDAWIGGG